MVNSTFCTDPEITSYINQSKQELDDLVVSALGEDYYASSVTFSTAANVANYSLSTQTTGTFYKLLGVDVSIGGQWQDVKPYNFHDRNAFQGTDVDGNYRYRIFGGNIILKPTPTAATSIQLHFVPTQNKFVTANDVIDDINGWSEFIVVSAAIKMKDKEESDTGVLFAQLNAIKKRIETMAPNRDAGEAMTDADVTGTTEFYDWPWC